MKKSEKLLWSLLAALALMVLIAGVMLVRSNSANKASQTEQAYLEDRLWKANNELAEAQKLADEQKKTAETQAAAYQQQIDEIQQTLTSAVSDRDTLAARVESMEKEAEQAAKDAEALQGRYDAASSSLNDQKQQIE